jgi:two-component sensor histidine kinase
MPASVVEQFLNMIVALPSLQGRSETSPEAASHLAIAANRVRAIAGLHQHLQSMDSLQAVEFKRYLVELCRDLSALSMSEACTERAIVVEAIEVSLPTTTGIPLSLIVNELVTNAIKHSRGRITVTLAQHRAGATRCQWATKGAICRRTSNPRPARAWWPEPRLSL